MIYLPCGSSSKPTIIPSLTPTDSLSRTAQQKARRRESLVKKARRRRKAKRATKEIGESRDSRERKRGKKETSNVLLSFPSPTGDSNSS
jgi:hypothetical protein